jgi:hypothetical protein
MNEKSVWKGIRLTLILISCLCGGWLSYISIHCKMNYLSLFIFALFFFSTVLVFCVPPIKEAWQQYLPIATTTLLLVIFINAYKDSSPVVYKVSYYWDEGLYFDFRKNGTYKLRQIDIMNEKNSYGSYLQRKDTIIMGNKVNFTGGIIHDTLIVLDKGIAFKIIESEKNIRFDTMLFTK